MTNAPGIQGTHRNIAEFGLHRPVNIAEACTLADNLSGHFAFMGGGVDLLQSLKSGRKIENLIFLKSVPELKSIEVQSGVMRIGACVTHHELETSPVIAKHAPCLASIWSKIGNVRVRIAGTLGGNILSDNPGYDGLPALIALNAVGVIQGVGGARRVPAANLNENKDQGLLSAIEIQVLPSQKFWMNRSLKPAVSVALSVELASDSIANARVGIGCAFPIPKGGPLASVEGLAPREVARRSDELAEEFASSLPEPLEDVFASSVYRRRMIAVLLARQLLNLAEV